MTLFASLAEDIKQARLIAKIGIGSNAELASNRVRRKEPDAVDISGELVGILRDELDGLVPIRLVDFYCICRRYYVEYDPLNLTFRFVVLVQEF